MISLTTMKAALIQFQMIPGHVHENEQIVKELIMEAANLGANTIVLPELWNTGYALDELAQLSQTLQGSSITLLQSLAREYQLFIFGGTIAERRNNQYYNTAVAINAAGDLVQKYRKIHLFPLGLKEPDYFEAGEEWGLAETPWGTMGMMTCYDLRFPELARNLALRGAKALIIPAQWPTLRQDHWQILNQARAIENQLYVLAVNRTGKDKSGKYSGCSMIIDPWGQIIAGGPEANQPGIILHEIDFSLLDTVRSKIPVYDSRCRILDEIDDSQL